MIQSQNVHAANQLCSYVCAAEAGRSDASGIPLSEKISGLFHGTALECSFLS